MTPLETVKAFLARMEAKEFSEAVKLISPDCEYTNMPIGTVRGPQGVLGVLEPFFAPIEQNEFSLLRTSAEGPVVFVERLDRHRGAHGWWELPVSGIFEVQDGRITLWREYFDIATMQRGMSGTA